MKKNRLLEHDAGLCVIGAGMAGLCAAISAARRGIKVALIHDRPVPGGNASGECRVHIIGADRHNRIKNMRETGILEELRMKNLAVNHQESYSVWDTILYETLRMEENITLFFNCSCLDAAMKGRRIKSVTGWQATTYTYHRIRAEIFADCSGDGILAPLTGAPFRMGREASFEYGESIAPHKADSRTMGMTCHFQARRHETPQDFKKPEWAYTYESCDQLPYGLSGHNWTYMGYWWVETGGENHGIHDTEFLRDELLKIVYGVWDHIKNHCPQKEKARQLALDWVQFLPAKRESVRYVGAHVLSQKDIESGGLFSDTVAYGGWPMDDHHPAGFNAVCLGAPATVFYPAPSPFGIPYRVLYSSSIDNLMFAGRNASCTHAAMSSTRVMGTACSMGQAVGAAAALALQKGVNPAGMLAHIEELQQALLYDDAYIPGVRQNFDGLTSDSELISSAGNPEPVRDGINRPVGENPHSWSCRPGDAVSFLFSGEKPVKNITLLLDSGLDRLVAMSHHQEDDYIGTLPDVMPKEFRIEGMVNGKWIELYKEKTNCMRLVRIKINRKLNGVRFILESTWGADKSSIYAFYIE